MRAKSSTNAQLTAGATYCHFEGAFCYQDRSWILVSLTWMGLGDLRRGSECSGEDPSSLIFQPGCKVEFELPWANIFILWPRS